MKNISLLVTLTLCALSGCMPYTQEVVVTEQYIHKYGLEVDCNDWQERGKDGTVITTLQSGVRVTRNFSQGELDGEVTYTYPYNTVIQKLEVYARGELVKEVDYSMYGAPQRQVELSNDRQTTTLWFENGTPRSVETIVSNKLSEGMYYSPNNELESSVLNGEGEKVERNIFGQLIATSKIKNGDKVLRRTYYPNGAPEWDESYMFDQLDGERKHYLLAGDPDIVERYQEGKKTLVMTFNAGEKFSEVSYVNGMKDGVEKRFRNGRELMEEISWSKDQRHGLSIMYGSGTPKEEWYFQDKVVSEAYFHQLNTHSPISSE